MALTEQAKNQCQELFIWDTFSDQTNPPTKSNPKNISGIIQPPRKQPSNSSYLPNLNCSWTFFSPKYVKTVLEINFIDLTMINLPKLTFGPLKKPVNDNVICVDKLMFQIPPITEPGRDLVLCNEDLLDRFGVMESYDLEVIIRFYSDHQVEGGGFVIEWKMESEGLEVYDFATSTRQTTTLQMTHNLPNNTNATLPDSVQNGNEISKSSARNLNIPMVILGVAGGCLVLIVIFIFVFRRCYMKKRDIYEIQHSDDESSLAESRPGVYL